MEVPKDDLTQAAQAVVDIATSPRVGGFLVSSVLDLEDGYGSGNVVVEVPAGDDEMSNVNRSTTLEEVGPQGLEPCPPD